MLSSRQFHANPLLLRKQENLGRKLGHNVDTVLLVQRTSAGFLIRSLKVHPAQRLSFIIREIRPAPYWRSVCVPSSLHACTRNVLKIRSQFFSLPAQSALVSVKIMKGEWGIF